MLKKKKENIVWFYVFMDNAREKFCVHHPLCNLLINKSITMCKTDFWFRDSSAQNPFGPGLLGPDISAHFSIRDCSAYFSETARPILLLIFFFFFFFLGGGYGVAIYCFILFMCIKTRFKKLYLTYLIFRQRIKEIIAKRPKYM